MHADDILVACLPPLHWSDGSIVNLNAIAPVCHANDILLVVDATQAVGVMPLDMQQIRPAMLACSIHKWLRGPLGASLVYIDKSLYETWEPLDQHGRSRDMIHGSTWEAYPNQMTQNGYPERFCRGARKFDSGGKPNSIVLPMLQKSLEQVVDRVDLRTSQAQLRMIVEPFLMWVERNQDKFSLPPGPQAYHLMGIRPVNQWLTVEQMLEIVDELQNDYRIYLTVRCGAFRVAPYLDMTTTEVEMFVKIFDKVVKSYYCSIVSPISNVDKQGSI
jgi:kynureninase